MTTTATTLTLTTFGITRDDVRRIVATETKKAAQAALGLSDWIARKHLAATDDEIEVRVATAEPGTVLESDAGEAGEFVWDAEPADKPATVAPKTTTVARISDRRPRGKSCASNFAEILENLGDALANEHEVGIVGCRTIARSMRRIGYIADTDSATAEAAAEVWETLETLHEHGRLDGSSKTDVISWRQHSRYSNARRCIERVYEVTDLLDRTMSCGKCGATAPQDSNIECACGGTLRETLRPQAFSMCLGYLMGRWAVGNFIPPAKAVINRWLVRWEFPSALAAA